MDKHLDEFDDLTGAAGYQREARWVVRESNRILAHIFEGRGIQLRDWKSKYGPGGVDNVFLYLAELDQSQNADLWQEVRKALATNEAFHDPGVQRYSRNEKLAREGQWWQIRPTGRKKPRRYRRHAAARDFVPERNLLSTLPHLVCVAGNGALFSHR